MSEVKHISVGSVTDHFDGKQQSVPLDTVVRFNTSHGFIEVRLDKNGEAVIVRTSEGLLSITPVSGNHMEVISKPFVN